MRRLSALLAPSPSRAGAPPAGPGVDPAGVRARAAAVGRTSATPLLVRALGTDPEPLVRAAAALALGDPSAAVRARAAAGLERAGLPGGAALRARLAAGTPGAHPDGPVARALARVETGGPLVVPDARP